MKFRDYVNVVLLAVVQGCIRFLGLIGTPAPRRIQKRLARIQLWLFERKMGIWVDTLMQHPTLATTPDMWETLHELDSTHHILLRLYDEI